MMNSSQTKSNFRFGKNAYYVAKATLIIAAMILFWNIAWYFVSCHQVNNLLNKHVPVNLVEIRLKHGNRIAIIADDELLKYFSSSLASSERKDWGQNVGRSNPPVDVVKFSGGTADIELYFTKNRSFRFWATYWVPNDNGLTFSLPFWADKYALEWHWYTHQFTFRPPYLEKLLQVFEFLHNIDDYQETKVLRVDHSGLHYSTLPISYSRNKHDYVGELFYYCFTSPFQVICTLFSFLVLIYCLKSIYAFIRICGMKMEVFYRTSEKSFNDE